MRGLRSGQGQITPPTAFGKSTAYTPAVTWTGSTLGSIVGFYNAAVPGQLTIWVSFTVTAPGGLTTLTIPLPGGYTSRIAAAASVFSTTGGSGQPLVIAAAGSSFSATANSTGASYVFQATIPIP